MVDQGKKQFQSKFWNRTSRVWFLHHILILKENWNKKPWISTHPEDFPVFFFWQSLVWIKIKSNYQAYFFESFFSSMKRTCSFKNRLEKNNSVFVWNEFSLKNNNFFIRKPRKKVRTHLFAVSFEQLLLSTFVPMLQITSCVTKPTNK